MIKNIVQAAILAACIIHPANAQETNKSNAYLFGSELSLDGSQHNDAYVAARTITAGSLKSQGDMIMAALNINIAGHIGESLIAAGNNISLTKLRIDEDLLLAGRNLIVDGDSLVKGGAKIAGQTLEFHGKVEGSTDLAGQEVILSGTFLGDVLVSTTTLIIQDNTVINGALLLKGEPRLVVSERAKIAGGITNEESQLANRFKDWQKRLSWLTSSFLALPLLLGLGLALFSPDRLPASAKMIKTRMWSMLGIGLGIILLFPILGALMMVTVVGIPVGVYLLATWPMVILFGATIGAYLVGDLLFKRIRPAMGGQWYLRMLRMITGGIILFAIGFVPMVGLLPVAIVTILGAGSVAYIRWRQGSVYYFK